MYPNPQSVVPLPSRPNLEQYKKQAKDLVKACKSADPAAIRQWVEQWRNHPVNELEKFVQSKLRGEKRACVLADAQYVIARIHGFPSWPLFAQHLDALARESSAVSAFESAADAIVDGDLASLQQLLHTHPDLIRARSTREHRALLLHYVAANGVEDYRQKTPKNAVAIAETLLASGAEADAEADMYGGGATTLGLVATSVHPFKAGVQNDLIDVLVRHGAQLDRRGAGNNHDLVVGCLANGRPEAAQHVAALGAPLDLRGAAGLGRLDAVQGFFNEDGTLKPSATPAQMESGFSWACSYGHTNVVEFLLERGMPVDARLRHFGHGHTALHVAAYGAHADIVALLVRRGASLNVTDDTWGTTPLVWALHAWSQSPMAPPEKYYEVVAMLVEAGAVVTPNLLEWDNAKNDPRMLAALQGG
jgi:ankyrin repeat protein